MHPKLELHCKLECPISRGSYIETLLRIVDGEGLRI